MTKINKPNLRDKQEMITLLEKDEKCTKEMKDRIINIYTKIEEFNQQVDKMNKLVSEIKENHKGVI